MYYTRRRCSFVLGSVIKHIMSDVPFTIVTLKASVRKHNKWTTVCLSQSRANLIVDMRKKGVTFPRDPRKHSSKTMSALGQLKTKKANSAMFKTTKAGVVRVRKSAGVKKTLVF